MARKKPAANRQTKTGEQSSRAFGLTSERYLRVYSQVLRKRLAKTEG